MRSLSLPTKDKEYTPNQAISKAKDEQRSRSDWTLTAQISLSHLTKPGEQVVVIILAHNKGVVRGECVCVSCVLYTEPLSFSLSGQAAIRPSTLELL